MDDANIISSEVSLTLGLPPSCIQFCPAHPDLFVVGTYNLEKNEDDVQEGKEDGDDDEHGTATKTPQNRNGSLLVFKVDGTKLHLVQTISQPSAILDLRFHPSKAKQDILAVVSSTGTLAVFKLDPAQNSSAPLQHISTSRCEDIGEDILFLQCNWHPEIPHVIGVTTSTSSARLLQLDEEYCIKDYTELNIANSLEAWCIAFSAGTAASTDDKTQVTAYCGGDDSMLRYTSCVWDPNDSDSPCEEPYSPITIKGTHNAGVTAILPLPLFTKNNGRVVVTGSYDDHLRVFIIHDLHETYGMKKVELVLEENMGGGVWRLDLVKIQKDTGSTKIRILASCMHAGARLVDLEAKQEQAWACKVLARFEEHKSMNYGSDFVRDDKAGEGLWCVSTSFYDKLLCLWKYKP
ncbi:wd repeat-containing 85 like [Fusarium sporotrichioides]|uniref:Wd repeat-containing 85 like n=1 Tax=Fusarium sporotrichioides TaxID=5514 RepID=A0A395S2A8_FUSSP|nr:wd repeat-containing 85 like [Fusarium sporotrichioides]